MANTNLIPSTFIIGAYSTREQAPTLRALAREHGEGWARDLTRDEYRTTLYRALVSRYGNRCKVYPQASHVDCPAGGFACEVAPY